MDELFYIELGNNEPVPVSMKAKILLDKLIDSVGELGYKSPLKLSENEDWKNLKNASQAIREDVTLIAFHQLKNYNSYATKLWKRIFRNGFSDTENPNKKFLYKAIYIAETNNPDYNLPYDETIFVIKSYVQNFSRNEYLNSFLIFLSAYEYAFLPEYNNFLSKVDKVLREAKSNYPFFDKDILGKFFVNFWNDLKPSSQVVFEHCFRQPRKSKPTKKWLKEANVLIQKLEEKDKISEIASLTFDSITAKHKELVKYFNGLQYRNPDQSYYERIMNADKVELSIELGKFHNEKADWYLVEENEVGIAYLTWFAALLNNEKVNRSIIELGISSFGKVRWFGNISTKIGNASLLAFTYMPENQGVVGLLTVKNKTKNKNVLKLADNHLKRKATELNLSEEALSEMAAPDFGMNGNFEIIKKIGAFEAVIETSNIKKPLIFWRKLGEEKLQKSIPASVKKEHGIELKALKKNAKDLISCFEIHIRRLENTYLDRVEWSFQDWEKNYINHPLLSKFSQLLIWQFDEKKTALFYKNEWIDFSGNRIDIFKSETVRLWHPIYSDASETENWRNFLLQNEIKQPFKQAYREIYLVTDAEIATDIYSNRFAAHIIKQHQFLQLCKIRRWDYTLQGGFDSYNTPSKKLPKWNARVEFFVEPVEDSLSDSNIYLYLSTDQVKFYMTGTDAKIENIPSILFSEIMRDVDLFVGVCSVGNDELWTDRGEDRYQTYWQNTSFGELSVNAQTRKAVLEKIIPKLKIANKTRIKGRFLFVEGKIRTYKIHLGSGNILMTPNDEYLCIVPSRSTSVDKIFLPFDDDRTLSIILSKAFLLASDDKIKDQTIIRQIKKV